MKIPKKYKSIIRTSAPESPIHEPKEIKMDETYYCSRPFEHMGLMYSGKVWPCCPPWLNTEYTYGNIETDSYEELWNNFQL